MSSSALRRTIHLSTAFLVLVGEFIGWGTFRVWISGLAAVAVVVEFLRLRNPTLGGVLSRAVPAFRPEESRKPSGAFWLVLGYVGAAWVPAPGAAAGILVGAVADPTASLVGSRWGGGAPKSWLGSLAALVASLGVLSLLGLPLATIGVASATAAAIERWSKPLDDNLVLAPAVAAVVWFSI